MFRFFGLMQHELMTINSKATQADIEKSKTI